MSLTSATLAAIQQAGAAVYAADAELKTASRTYAERVTAAMGSNPYGLGNDALFENWKLVARLSQAMAGIEEELKKVYHLAADLVDDGVPATHAVPVLAAPTPVVALAHDLAPTDVVVKRRKKVARQKAAKLKPSAGPKARRAKGARADNPTRLLSYLSGLLNTGEFTVVSQTASAKATGIPLGSMTAALKKLVANGLLMAGPGTSYKLLKSH